MRRYIVSIDPGIVNMGFATMECASKAVLDARRVTLFDKMRDCKSEEHMIARLHEKLFCGELGTVLRGADAIVVENQMKRPFILLQHAVAGVCREIDVPCRFVHPRTIKSHFDTGAASRGALRSTHADNKKAAVAKAAELFRDTLHDVKGKKDDVSDALLQALWYVEEGHKTATHMRMVVKVRRKAAKKAPAKTKRKPKAAEPKAPAKKAALTKLKTTPTKKARKAPAKRPTRVMPARKSRKV